MKRYIYIIIILISSITYGQKYIPLLNDSNRWYFTRLGEGFVSELYYFNGDTIYDSVEYKIIGDDFRYNYNSPNNGFIREDTLTQCVYFLSSRYYYDDPEILLYDFSLEQGDTVNLYVYWFQKDTTFVVDSVGIFNTSFDSRRIYYLSGPGKLPQYTVYPVWIEGIGTLGFNLYTPAYPPHSESALSCFYTGDSLIYQSSYSVEFGACYYETWGIENLTYFNLNIFPNPFYDIINIEGDYSNRDLKIEIFNPTGKLLWHQQIINNKGYISESFKLDHLLSGFYFLKLSSDNKIETLKIIKNAAYH
jgi:hypothetical protein